MRKSTCIATTQRLAPFSTSFIWHQVELFALCFVLGELVVDGVLDGATKWRLKCFGAFSDFDGGGSGVGFGKAVAKVLVLHGSFDEVFGGAHLGRLVCSFLVKDGGLDYPSVGLLSWLLLVAAAMDFLRVVDSFGGAGSYILVGVWLVFAVGILGGGGLFFWSPVLLLATAGLVTSRKSTKIKHALKIIFKTFSSLSSIIPKPLIPSQKFSLSRHPNPIAVPSLCSFSFRASRPTGV